MSEEEASTENASNANVESPSKTNGDVNDDLATKKSKSKKPNQKESTEEQESSSQNEIVKPSKTSKKNDLSRKNRKHDPVDDEDDENESGIKRVPLLDQNPIVDGPRNRKLIVDLGATTKPVKHTGINIPNGKGTSLGRIPVVNTRMKRLTIDETKSFHRFLFGKLGKIDYLITNIQRFNGFCFEKDSDQYARKLVALNKLNVHLLKEYLFFLDLDLKIKKKEDISKAILEFLLKPYKTENSVNPAVVTHPKRKATKRNYYEKEFKEDRKEDRKVKKKKHNAKTVKEKEGASGEDETSKTGKEKDKNENADSKDAEEDKNATTGNTNNSQELTKPAKKRKRNQVIEETEENTDDSKTKKTKESDETKSKPEISDKKMLTDEELREFLKKVLTDANLEKTTMKTVYNLISTHYPNYNFVSKKDLIKEIVKSLIQS